MRVVHMGQSELYEWLKQRRIEGDDDYFTINEMRTFLYGNDDFINVRKINVQIRQLIRYKVLEVEPDDGLRVRRRFRYRMLDNDSRLNENAHKTKIIINAQKF